MTYIEVQYGRKTISEVIGIVSINFFDIMSSKKKLTIIIKR